MKFVGYSAVLLAVATLVVTVLFAPHQAMSSSRAPPSFLYTTSATTTITSDKNSQQQREFRALVVGTDLHITEIFDPSSSPFKDADIIAHRFATFGKFNESEVNLVAFSPPTDNDGSSRIAFAQDNSKVTVVSVRTGSVLASTRDADEMPVYAVAFSQPDGKRVATAGEAEMVREYKAADMTRIGKPMGGHNSRIRTLVYSPDGKMLASGGMSGDIRIFDVAEQVEKWGSPLHAKGHTRMVRSLAFSDDGAFLVSSGYDAKICVWDAVLLQLIECVTDVKRMAVTAVAFVPAGAGAAADNNNNNKQIFAAGTHDGRVIFYDVQTRKQVGDILVVLGSNPISSLSFRKDGAVLAVAATAMNPNKGIGSVKFFDVAARSQIGVGGGGGAAASSSSSLRFHGKKSEVYAAIFSPSDLNILATASADGTVKLLDVTFGRRVSAEDDKKRRLDDPSEPIEKVRFSTNGEYVYATGTRGSEKQWDVLPSRSTTGATVEDEANEDF